MNILVLCTGNSARSILLESILNSSSAGRVQAYSAGSRPTGRVHPQSLKLLAELGHRTSGFRSKDWGEFSTSAAPEMDAVITVCGSAAAETCPIWPGTPLRAHWGVEDPAHAPQNALVQAFQDAYAALNRKATAFLEAPFEKMTHTQLQTHLNAAGDL